MTCPIVQQLVEGLAQASSVPSCIRMIDNSQLLNILHGWGCGGNGSPEEGWAELRLARWVSSVPAKRKGVSGKSIGGNPPENTQHQRGAGSRWIWGRTGRKDRQGISVRVLSQDSYF